MSTQRLVGALSEAATSKVNPVEDKELKKGKDEKQLDHQQIESDEEDEGYSFEGSDIPHDYRFLTVDFKCEQHSSYKVIDLDQKQENGEIKEEKVRVCFANISNGEIFQNFFKRIPRVKILCVDAVTIDFLFSNAFRNFLENKHSLRSLHIRAKKIDSSRFLYPFEIYSSLEDVSLSLIDRDAPDINTECQQYINRNKQVRHFVSRMRAMIASIPVREEKTRDSRRKVDEAFLIRLASVYDEAWQLCDDRFIEESQLFRLIANDNSELLAKLTKAKEYHPLWVVSVGNVKLLREIFSIRTDLNVNAIYVSYQPISRRLIDLATNNDVIQYLINERKVDATSFEDQADGHGVVRGGRFLKPEETNLLLRMNNGLGSLFSSRKGMIDFKSLNSFADIIYDCLAYAIVGCKTVLFEEIMKEYGDGFVIDIGRKISHGIYAGYTLFQLICLHYDESKNNIIFAAILGKFKELSHQKQQSLFHSQFPAKRKYADFADFTVLQYLTVHLHASFLLEIIPDKMSFEESNFLKITNDKSKYYLFLGYNLLQLFIQFLIKINDFSSVKEESILSYYNLLKSVQKCDIKNLQLKDNNGRLEFLIFCYAARNSKSTLAINFSINVLFKDLFLLDRRFDCMRYRNVTYFHMSLLLADNLFCKRLLRKLLSKITNSQHILSLLSETVDSEGEYQGCTLFQLAVLFNQSEFIAACIDYSIDLSSLVNKPYPHENYQYAGWTPIQVAVYKVKKGDRTGDLFSVLLRIKGIDLNVCYPNNVYLGGLSILQAVLVDVSYDPYKFAATGRIFGKFTVQELLNKLSPDQINYVCEERSSGFYGMTGLHIAVRGQEEEHVQILLDSEKTDYTITDSFRQTPLEVAEFLRYGNNITYLKNAVRKSPQHKEKIKYCSEVCPSLEVKQDRWVISIARENNNHHAFLIFEGLQQEEKLTYKKAVVWVAQLYLPRSSNSLSGKARIDIEHAEEKLTEGRGKTKHLLSVVKDKLKPLVQLNLGAMLFYASAFVDSKDCQRLIGEIEKEKQKMVPYWVCGRPTISATIRRHNCVSWAIEKYNSIVPERNKLSKDWSSYFFTSAKGFLNEHFIYIADASFTRDLLREEVSRLSKRLLENRNTLFANQNRQWSLLGFMLCMLLCHTAEYPNSGLFRLMLSLVAGSVASGVFKYLLPKDREYNEDPRPGGRSP